MPSQNNNSNMDNGNVNKRNAGSDNKSGVVSTLNRAYGNYRQPARNSTNSNSNDHDQQLISKNTQHHHQQQQQQQQQQHLQQQYFSDDNMEYYIKFPNNTRNHDFESAESSDFVFINDSNVPIVLLLGWAGCLDRYLLKYSKIYEDRGLITVRYTAPLKSLFWKRSAMQGIGDKILKLIYDMNFDSHPLIFHVFSNGGAYLYEHISMSIRNQHLPIHVRGMIFDSAPGERRVLGLYRAISAIYGRDNRKCNFLAAWTITISLTFMWFAEETYVAFKGLFKKMEPQNTNPFHDLKTELSDWPQLFLYSKADAVIPYQDVENFARYRENRGVPVTKVCFEDAEHVKIFIKYPQQYIHCICKFVNDCLTSFKGISNYN